MSAQVPAPQAITREEFLGSADHTLLDPAATQQHITEFLAQARDIGVRRVCITPVMLPVAEAVLGDLEIVTVVGFPTGAHAAAAKAAEARIAVAAGAHEIDMVLHPGAVQAGQWEAVEAEIAAVRATCPQQILKVIIESATLSDTQIVECCLAAKRAGADFVKTSTGMHPSGGASVHAVKLMADTVGGALGVKASGGVRTAAAVRELAAAGATRFGVSGTAAIVAEWERDVGEATHENGAPTQSY